MGAQPSGRLCICLNWRRALINLLDLFRPRETDHRYSIDEVLDILRGERHDARAEAALGLISAPSTWLPADSRDAFGSLAWYSERLPTIFHLYRKGWATEQIGRRLSPLGGAWAIERTLEVAAGLIADRLNRGNLAA
jgi:hypothetical protein